MEKGRKNPPEAIASAISAFFDEESKTISSEIKEAESMPIGVNANRTVTRRDQKILHLEQSQTELDHTRAFVLRIFNNTPQAMQASEIRGFFEGKLDEISIETERVSTHPHGVILEGGIVKGIEQELDHLTSIRADMFRIGNHVLSLFGEPPLADEEGSPVAVARDESG